MSTTQEKAIEARARRAARSVGLAVTKSRGALHYDNQGGFMLVDPHYNNVVDGVRYELSAEDVIEFCRERRV